MKFATAFSGFLASTLLWASCSPAAASDIVPATVVDIAVESPDHTTLVAAVTAAGLVGPLSEEGPYTIFAPVDDAFENVDTDRLLLPEFLPHLVDLLAYHVIVETEVLSTDLSVGLTAEMLNGETINVTSLDPPTINGNAEITTADVEAENGFVHVIDQVLLPVSATNSIVDLAAGLPESFSTLVDLVVTAGLAETLAEEGPFTVFAPTNDAFAKLPNGTIESLKLPENANTLANILTYHVTPGVVVAAMLEDNSTVTMLNNQIAPVRLAGGPAPPMIGPANITLTDLLVTNGVVHVIDTVLLPPEAEDATTSDTTYETTEMEDETTEIEDETTDMAPSNTVVDIAVGSPDHQTLVAAVTATGLVEILASPGPFTVFAPVDSAFATVDTERLLLPEYLPHLIDLLTYHVVAGQVMSTDLSLGLMPEMINGEMTNVTSLDPPMINQATLTAADLTADNGVVHVIDQVLLPASATNTIVDLAVGSPDLFSTLVDLVVAAGLAETLSTGGPFTVFAPTNDAFAALPQETIDNLLLPENEATLVDILTYHVTPGIVTAEMLREGMMVSMLNDKSAPITLTPSPMIGPANIVATDILGTNG
jgi:transforming growth factor-beta-induced protein